MFKKYIKEQIIKFMTSDEEIKEFISKELQKSIDDVMLRNIPKVKLNESFDTKHLNVWYVIENYQVYNIEFCVNYTNGSDPTIDKFSTFPDLLEYFQNFKHTYNFINGCHLKLFYIHPEFGKQTAHEFFINTFSGKTYKIDEIYKVMNHIKTFLKKKPELLI